MEDELNSTEQVTVSLPAQILTQIDAQVGSGFVDRDDYIRAAVRFYLDAQQQAFSNTQAADIG